MTPNEEILTCLLISFTLIQGKALFGMLWGVNHFEVLIWFGADVQQQQKHNHLALKTKPPLARFEGN